MTRETLASKQGTGTAASMVGYLIFCCLEVLGMALILWDGVPLFRQLLQFQQGTSAADNVIMFVAVILIQYSYWTRLRHDPPFALPSRPFVAHLVIFASRLSFIFASSVFSLVVYRHSDFFEFDLVRTPLMGFVLFSVFCFSRHLEKLGQLLLNGFKPAPAPRAVRARS